MKLNELPLIALLFWAHLRLGLCRHRSSGKSNGKDQSSKKDELSRGPHYPGPKIPGIPISHLMDLSVLDPYNIMSGKSFESKETASLVHQIIPLAPENVAGFSQRRRPGDRKEDDGESKPKKHKPGSESRTDFKDKKVSKKRPKAENLPTFHGALEEDWPLTDDAEESLDYDGVDYVEKSSSRKSGRKAHRKHKKLFSKVEKGRNVLLHEAVRKLLGFSKTQPGLGEESRYLPDPTRERRLPRYVKDLYKRFQSGEIGAAGLAQGNTVRSIHTTVGSVKGQPMFLFNVSSLRPSEKLISAEIHLFKRRLRRWTRAPEVEVVLYQVAPHFISQVGKITILEGSKPGWQWYDVTTATGSCLAGRKLRKPYVFGLSFRSTRDGKTRPLPLKKFGRHHSLPFLVVHSNETEAVNFEQLDHLAGRLFFQNKDQNLDKEEINTTELRGQDQFSSEDEEDDVDEDDDGNDDDRHTSNEKSKVISDSRRENTTSQPEDENEDKAVDSGKDLKESEEEFILYGPQGESSETLVTPTENPESLKPAVLHHFENRHKGAKRFLKRKRSIRTNEIPTDPTDYEKYLKRQKKYKSRAHQNVLRARKASKFAEKDEEKSRLLPSPDVYAKYQRQQKKENERRRRKNRRKKKKKKHRSQYLSNSSSRHLRTSSEWGPQRGNKTHSSHRSHKEETLSRNEDMSVCGRRKLVVDFADIGWEDWIISPKSFEAHYCAGECPFPLTKRLRPSNHATIQSIVHAVGIYDQVPAPCCVPDQMSPITLLYFDEDKNVVLKNYPGMTVDSCACR